MPYKDPERKKEWERLHRSERLARRRQLRQIEAVEHRPQRREVTVAIFKKGWAWWLVGCVILVLALSFYPKDQQDSETNLTKTV